MFAPLEFGGDGGEAEPCTPERLDDAGGWQAIGRIGRRRPTRREVVVSQLSNVASCKPA
jgi:hypothetical protein